MQEQKAVITIQGHQYCVALKDHLVVDGILGQAGDTVTFNQVHLLIGAQTEVGTPVLNKTVVTAVIDQITKSPKLKIATYKAKSRYRKIRGHRQAQTSLTINSIGTMPAPKAPAKKA